MQTKQKNLRYNQTIYYSNDKIEKVAITVIIQTSTNIITGDIYVRPMNRLIDEMNDTDKFLAVTDAVVYEASGKVRFRTACLTVNFDNIVLIIPKEDLIHTERADSQLKLKKQF